MTFRNVFRDPEYLIDLPRKETINLQACWDIINVMYSLLTGWAVGLSQIAIFKCFSVTNLTDNAMANILVYLT